MSGFALGGCKVRFQQFRNGEMAGLRSSGIGTVSGTCSGTVGVSGTGGGIVSSGSGFLLL